MFPYTSSSLSFAVIASARSRGKADPRIIGSNVYQASDRPRYLKANKGLIAVIAFNIVLLYPGTWLFYRYHNRKREAIWSRMSGEEKAEYLRTTKDTGNKRLDFRFDL